MTGLDPQPPFVVQPVEVAHVMVPLDGSPLAERALLVGAWVAAGVGAHVHLIEVVPCDAEEESEGAVRYVDSVARLHRAAAWDVVERNDVGAALADALGSSPGGLACLATHGRGRSVLLGSVAGASFSVPWPERPSRFRGRSLLEHSSQPVVLVGPVARAVTAADAPIVVAVDGTGGDAAHRCSRSSSLRPTSR